MAAKLLNSRLFSRSRESSSDLFDFDYRASTKADAHFQGIVFARRRFFWQESVKSLSAMASTMTFVPKRWPLIGWAAVIGKLVSV